MKTYNTTPPLAPYVNDSARFTRSDLMELESYLAANLRELLAFSSHSLYFPTSQNMPQDVQWISRERTLLLPLCHKEEKLGVFMARGVSAKTVHRLMRSFPAILNICMEHMACIKQSQIDEWTGLARMSGLLKRMVQHADLVRSTQKDLSHDTDAGLRGAYNVCMGLVVIRCPALDSLAVEFGHAFANMALATWAHTIQQYVPSEATAARSAHNECTILLPAATRTLCQNLAEDILTHIEELTLVHEASKRSIRLHGVAGFSLYPQDIDSRRLALPMEEQSQHMLYKARIATDIIYERSTYLSQEEKAQPQNRLLAFGRLLAQGGLVRHVLSHNHLMTNLGKHMGAQEGQRFTVWGSLHGKSAYKGEIVLIDVRKTHSVAEVLHLADAAWLWEAGDNLYLAQGIQSTTHSLPTQNATSHSLPPCTQENSENTAPENVQHTTEASLFSHGEFLQHFHRHCESHDTFTLALVRVQSDGIMPQQDALAALTTVCEQKGILPAPPANAHKVCPQSPVIAGRYGETSLVFFHASADTTALEALYTELAHAASTAHCPIAIGIASYPCLDYAKTDMLDCSHKALELAILLPMPHVGLMGSLALNISADQHYSRGDVFAAVEEYKRALLADEKNAMAWNSLGVCMASLARHTEARQHFKQALSLWKKQTLTPEQRDEFASTLYNLGTVCQKLDDTRAAAGYFRQCVQEDSEYFYAYLRLGQLAEKGARYGQARQYYTKAAGLQPTNDTAMHKNHTGTAHRHLARVALAQSKEAEARELLHEALLRNPGDAAALSMLAEIYLHAGEDPEMSEMLLRKSLGLRPDHASTWQLLARCLREQGQHSAALDAEDRAANL